METKSIMYNPKLLIQHLKEKKNWAFLTSLILLIAVIVMPLLLETDIHESFVVVGIVVVFIVTLVNCFIDFNYLHDSKKFGYYMSKPMNHVQRLHLNLLTNGIFAGFFMTLLVIFSLVNDLDVQAMFLPAISWLLILMFLTALSSYLCGNTIFAGLSTGFNFILPLFVYAILQFSVSLVTSITRPYNMSLVMDYFMNKYYQLDVIYFIKFANDFNIIYVVYLCLLLLGIYTLTRHLILKRENEKIGQFIVFRGFERFIAVMFSLVVPFIFTAAMPSNSFVLKTIAYVLLGSLTYYVASIILEKSFKLSKKSFKVLIVFMSIFLSLIFIISFYIKTFNDEVPEFDDLKSVLITNNGNFYNEDEYLSIVELNSENYGDFNLVAYESEASIKAILKIHEWILEKKSGNLYSDVNIIYEFKDGSYDKNFYYVRNYGDELDDAMYQEGVYELIDSLEYKMMKFPFVYDDAFAEDFVGGVLSYVDEKGTLSVTLDIEKLTELRTALQIDTDRRINLRDYINTYAPVWDNYSSTFDDYDVYGNESKPTYFNVFNGNEQKAYVNLTKDYVETHKVLENWAAEGK